MEKEERCKIKKILKKFKSKNGVNLFAYIGTWHGAKGNEEIKYIEREDNREYVDSFILDDETPKYLSLDKTLSEKIKELKNILILKYFNKPMSSKEEYAFDIPYEEKPVIDEIMEELKELIKCKKNIGFNEDWGVGSVHYESGKYLVELNVYCNLSFPVGTRNLKEVIKWLIKFSSGKGNYGTPFDYGRAMGSAFSKDMRTKKERAEIMKDYKKQVKEALSKIK